MGIDNHLGRSFSWERRSKSDSGDWTSWGEFSTSTPTSPLFYHTHYAASNIIEGVTYQFRIKLINSNPAQYSNVLEKYLPGKNGGILTYTISYPCRTGVDKAMLTLSNYLGDVVRWEYRITYWDNAPVNPKFVTSPWNTFSTTNSPTAQFSMPVVGPSDVFNSTIYDFRAVTNNGTCEATSNEVLNIGASTQEPTSIVYYKITANKTLQIGPDGHYTISMCDGDTLKLTGNYKFGGPSYYEWSTGETTQSIYVTKAGDYSFLATWRQAGCERYGPEKRVTVVIKNNPKPTITSTYGPINGSYVCTNGTIGLTSSDSHLYYWSHGPTTKSVIVPVGGPYYVEALYGNGCLRRSDPVTVKQKPNILTPDKTICSGDAANLQLTSDYSGATFSWSVFNKSTNVSNITVGATGTGNLIPDVINTNNTSQGTVIYQVNAAANSCVGERNVTVKINTSPIVTTSPVNPLICQSSGVSLTASGASTYNWSPTSGLSSATGSTVTASPLVTTTYTVVGTGSNGCSKNATVSVEVKPKPQVLTSNKTICSGASTSLALTSDLSGTTYSWSVLSKSSTITGTTVGSAGVTTSINHVLTNSSTSTAGSVVYRITPITNACTGAYRDVTVTVNPKLNLPTISVSGNLCVGDVTLTASSGTSYQWSNGATSRIITVSYSGTFYVRVTNSNGCTIQSNTVDISSCSTPDPCSQPQARSGIEGMNQEYPYPPCPESIAAKTELVLKQTTVYPNPVRDELTVQLPLIAEFDIPVKIYSQYGQELKSELIGRGKSRTIIDLRSLNNGFYIVKLEYNSKLVQVTRKLVINHNP